MALKIIGSGLGRTGTASLKQALEQLGFPCHHMIEVFMHPEQPALWVDAAKGRPNWAEIYKNYTATTDYPGCIFWRELMAEYPDALVLHSTRDPEQWFESTQATIFAPGRGPSQMPPHIRPMFEALFEGRLGLDRNNHDEMIAYFKRHEEEIMHGVPAKKLLVFNAKEGWGPLCKFLDLPVPATPFPKNNTREEFRARVASGASILAKD
jgi:hypothetical protein